MSYDILAFDPTAASDEQFPAWWRGQSQWTETHGYDDTAVTTPQLRGFYDELVLSFPDMQSEAADEVFENGGDESTLTDYSIGTRLVYAAFAWSQAEAARKAFESLAAKHGVAVAWVSDDASIVRPAPRG